MKRFLLFCFLVLLVGTAVIERAAAQGCSLCASQTNSGESANMTKYRGQTLNTGILYLAAVPYLAGGALGLVWYRNRRRLRQQAAAKR
ncbi:MAG: hypothetical protein H7330_07170 [Hymenobacteraceae bacterium]|nr:hypothetical protein [Hymenobacteraceae bacterium]